MLKNNTDIVAIPPQQSAFCNCEKVVDRDVEAYREKAQSICMHLGIRLGDVVSHNAQFSATFKEQQTICGMLDHRQSNPCVAALALVRDATLTIALCNRHGNLEPDLELNGQF